jgi:hypothetical protein
MGTVLQAAIQSADAAFQGLILLLKLETRTIAPFAPFTDRTIGHIFKRMSLYVEL